MADQLQFPFVVDEADIEKKVKKGFDKVTEQAKVTAEATNAEFKTIGDVFSTDVVGIIKKELLSIPATTAIVALSIAGLGFLIKEAFDLAKEGEQIKAVERQFENLAESAGLAGRELEQGLKRSAKGLVDTTELLRISKGALIELGASAQRLPELLELSRKVTLALGGDLKDRFEGILLGIESGNQKALKAQGIYLDVDKALLKYATSLGVAAKDLDKAQQQQALLNAVLEQGNKKFKDVESGLAPISVALKRIGVQFTESGEDFAKSANTFFGPAISSVLTKFADLLTKANETRQGLNASGLQKVALDAADVKAQLIKAESQFASLNKQLVDAKKVGDTLWIELIETSKTRLVPEIEGLKKRYAELTEQVKEVSKEQNEVLAANFKNVNTKTPEEIAAEKERQAQLEQLQNTANEAYLQNEETRIGRIRDVTLREQELQMLHSERLAQIGLERSATLAAIDVQYSTKNGFDEEQRLAAREATQKQFDAKIENENRRHLDKINQDANKRSQEYAAIIKNGLSSSLQNVGKALQAGTNAFDAFGSGVVGILGDLMIKMGEALLFSGQAIEAFADAINLPVPGSGLAAAAAGAGLIIFGGVLKASVGAGSSSSSSGGGLSGGGGGGTAGSSNSGTSFFAENDSKPQGPMVNVALNISGPVMGTSDKTLALALADVLSDQFSSQGLVIKA